MGKIQQYTKVPTPSGLTKSARVTMLSALGRLMGIPFKVGEVSHGARRVIEPGDST